MLVYERMQAVFGRKITVSDAVTVTKLFNTSVDSLYEEESAQLASCRMTVEEGELLYKLVARASILGVRPADLLSSLLAV